MRGAALTVEVTTINPDVVVVAVAGELDAESGPGLHQELGRQLALSRRHLVLDFVGVPFMDSSGLNIIIRALNATREVHGSLRIAGANSAVRRILELTGVSLSTPLHETVADALTALAGRSAEVTEQVQGPCDAEA